jgi:hypothetical protein
MKFYVIWSDGRKFGPADIATLNQWAQERRINRDTEVENAETGQRGRARDIQGLAFPTATPDLGGEDPALKAGEQPLRSASSGPVIPGQPQPYIAGRPQDPGQSPYQTAPTASPYPRPGYNVQTYDTVPAELTGGFNVGAFFFTWIWGLNHKAYWMLWAIPVSFIPCGGLVFSIICGLKGNEAAWKSGRFASVQDCLNCQRIWMWWGIGMLIAVVVIYGFLFATGMMSDLS